MVSTVLERPEQRTEFPAQRSRPLDESIGKMAPPVAAPDGAVVARSEAELLPHVPAWEALAADAADPNVFHEPWVLLPALRTFSAPADDVRVVLTYLSDRQHPTGPAVLGGVFPLQRVRRYRGLPAPAFRLWQSDYTFNGTPLLKTGYERAAWAALFTWLASGTGNEMLLELGQMDGEGAVPRALVEYLHQTALPIFQAESHTRALLRRSPSADGYINQALPAKRRKELRRQSHRLADLGTVEYATLGAQDDATPWLDAFLELEASGWKGKNGTALACHEHTRVFFENLATEAHQRGRLQMLALRLNGRPIAMKCNLRAGDGAFAFKICFDEQYALLSPGVLLELENIRLLHATPGLNWMDSCAVPEHSMINRLWMERRIIQTMVLPTGKRTSHLLVSALPLLRWAHTWRRKLPGREQSPQTPPDAAQTDA